MIFHRRGAESAEGFSGRQFVLCALFRRCSAQVCVFAVLFLLTGCVADVLVTAVPTLAPTAAPLAAISPTSTPDNPTALPTKYPTPLPTALPTVPPTEHPTTRPADKTTGRQNTPTPTFAAYGVQQSIGRTVDGRSIDSYSFGYGTRKIVLVGGMHGGYEWNTIQLAYRLIDYFTENPQEIPADVTLIIIPAVNVDGQFLITGRDGRFALQDVALITVPGRFNARGVDLNRNWNCDWTAEAEWNGRTISGGSEPFSEPETQALRRFFLRQRPEVVVFWHSKANGVFGSGCEAVDEASLALGRVYGRAAAYPVFERFTAYPVTGDASDWLAEQGIPSFTVELETHNQTEWRKNLAGVQALLRELSRSE
ncbi:MAG TPA: hypothetical protein ENK32_05070 [Anaerolineae bacterium]|nr:hypothetical protein [Anaerolineae bacterium]